MTVKSALAMALLLVLCASLFLMWRRSRSGERAFKSTDEFIQWLASQAVEDAESQNHIHLDYSVESIKSVEKILGQLHEQYAKNPSSISEKGLGSAYGAYVGEVIRRSEPGARWERDDAAAGEKSYPLIWASRAFLPASLVQKADHRRTMAITFGSSITFSRNAPRDRRLRIQSNQIAFEPRTGAHVPIHFTVIVSNCAPDTT